MVSVLADDIQVVADEQNRHMVMLLQAHDGIQKHL